MYVYFAIATLIWITIPQPREEPEDDDDEDISEEDLSPLAAFRSEITFGIRYIWKSKGLCTFLLITTLF